MYIYKLSRQITKIFNRPPSSTYIKQKDFDLEFYNYPQAGEKDFYLPRKNFVVEQVDGPFGKVIDFGIDWGKATLNVSNAIVPRTFIDELSGYLDENPDKYLNFLQRKYYISNYKSERWSVSLNNNWTINYLATIAGQPGKNISGDIIGSYDIFFRSRYLFYNNNLSRAWSYGGFVLLSEDGDWESPQMIASGINPSIDVDSTGKLYIVYERSGKIYYKYKFNDVLSDEFLVNKLDEFFTLPSPSFDPDATYKEPFTVISNDIVWIFYTKIKDGRQEICYVVLNQSFEMEHRITTLDGIKSDLFAYLADDRRIFITWINSYNGISNVFFTFSATIQTAFFGRANVFNEVIPHENSICPTDSYQFELIKV